MADEPQQRLAEGQRLLDAGDLDASVQILAPLTGHPDAELSGAAWLSIGDARYRLDDEPGALAAWQQAAQRGGSGAWLGWRKVAEQEVRDGHLEEAVTAYREADRRAPPEERGAIANRIAWLLKETGHDFASRRQFNRARGAYATYQAWVTWAIIAINVAVFLVDGALGGSISLTGSGSGPLSEAGFVYGPAVAHGEWWRLITGAFLHLNILHIAFNMYALWLFGPIIEQMYGHVEFAVIYLLCALGGNVLTILVAPTVPALGASGAIFGLFGLAFIVSRRRHLLLVPANVPTMGGMWRAPDGSLLARRLSPSLRASAYLLVAAALVLGTYVAIQQLG
jgi:membrane associated rhomboid family serine protease